MAWCNTEAETDSGDEKRLIRPQAKNVDSGTAHHGLSAVRLKTLPTTSTVKPSREGIVGSVRSTSLRQLVCGVIVFEEMACRICGRIKEQLVNELRQPSKCS